MSYCRFRVMADSTPTLKQRLAGRSLYLVGMMGSGKTSTAAPWPNAWATALWMPMP